MCLGRGTGVIGDDCNGWHDYFSEWTGRHVSRELSEDIQWQFTNPDFNKQVEAALTIQPQ